MTHPYISTIGIDVSKKHLDLYHSLLKITKRYDNNSQSLAKLIKYIVSNPVDCILFEPSGGYERKLLRSLVEKQLPFVMIHALHVRKFAEAKGQWAKTDAIDAALLAEYGLKMQPELTSKISSLNYQVLRTWSRRRTQVTNLIRLEKQYLEQQDNQQIIDLIQKNISTLKDQIKLIDQKIQQVIEQDSSLCKKAALLNREKGIGQVCTTLFLCELPELGQVNHKEIAALVGVAPYNRESGSWKGYQQTTRGRKVVRCALYMAIISAIRYNPKIKSFYDRLIAKGKRKKVALTACMRKLLIVLNATLKQRFYHPEVHT